jgi:hypothetical protein
MNFLQRNLINNTVCMAFDPLIPPSCVDGAIGPDYVVLDPWKDFYLDASD